MRTKSSDAADLVTKFWQLMETNDFRYVGSLLADDFVLDWPQSGERIRGRDNYAAMNEEYPTSTGRWTFTVNRIVGNEHQAVSDVTVTDGGGKIVSMIEFWPEPFEALENRRHLVERIDPNSQSHA